MNKVKYFSKLTIGLAAYIVISASFMLQIRNFLVKTLGGESVKLVFVFLFFLTALLYILYILRMKIPVSSIIYSVFIFVLGYLLISRQPYFTEKIHVLEYGILGYLALRDLSKKNKKIFKNILLAIFFISVIGIMDETFQKFLPYRVGEIRDVATNVVSGLLGIFQYFIYRGSVA
ncbi:MAG: VanZ family protein [Candidatus Omnitrophica bacterium]|nr:VanZ family protein [Candidatus Omnitrophota bacterium]